VQAIKDGIISMWVPFMSWMQTKLSELLTLLRTAPGFLGGGSPFPSVPSANNPNLPNQPRYTPLVPIPSPSGYIAPPTAGPGAGGSIVNNNITVNNPSAEPASSSIQSTMIKMSYGVL